MHPRKLVRDSVGFAVAQYVVRAALMLRGVIAARLLGPFAYGAWNALTLVFDYGTLAALGTQQGLDQAVPGRIVAADPSRLEGVKRAGLFNILLLTGVFAAACLFGLVRSHGRILAFWGLGGVLLALLCMALINLSNYYLTLLRSHGNIPAVSTWFVLQGAIGTVLGLSLVPFVGAWGLLWGWLAGTACALVYAHLQSRGAVPLAPRVSHDSLALVQIGLPMFLYTASALVMRSIDRIIILRFLGTEQLGYYGLAIMVLSLLLYLPDSVAYVLYPHFVREFHAAGDRPEAIAGRVDRTLRVLSVAVPGLCGLTFLVAREGAIALLPQFVPGATAARILCFGAGALALANLSSIVLMTLGRRLVLMPAAVFVTALGASLDWCIVRAGYGITGVAWATLATFCVHGALLLWLSLQSLGFSLPRRLWRMARLYLPLVASILLAFVVDRYLPWAEVLGLHVRLARVSLGAVTFLALYGLATAWLVRGLGLRQLLQEFNAPRLAALRRAAVTDA